EAYEGRDASHNEIKAVNSTLGYQVIGGGSGKGEAIGNKVQLVDSKAALVIAAGIDDGPARDNEVRVKGGIILADTARGVFMDDEVWGDPDPVGIVGAVSESGGDVENNRIVIDGAEVHGAVITGLAGEGNALDNRLTLRGDSALADATLFGG